MKTTNEIVTNIIKGLGIPASIKGYHYTRYAVMLMIDDTTLMNNITKNLYPMVANHFDTTPTSVERGIRHAIGVGWNRANVDFAKKLFGSSIYTIKGKPTNSEFLATIADYVLMTQDNHREERK